MLPIYLSIEGVYSYQEKQEVDFTSLTEAGLFGIFGNVGSGKSTILEAISFALYGITERINKTDNRTYNMLNLKSNAACIVFDFLNFEGRKFRFVAQWKRKNKHFQETSTLVRTAYEWKNDDWSPLESADGSLYTNLTYSNFKRTIIIPQGQFREFLDLKGTDRSTMMKEIFQLDRFDLGMNVSKLQKENNNRIENLKGALSGFELVSAEALESKKEEFASAKKQLAIAKTEFDVLDSQYKKLTEAKEIRTELLLKEKAFAELAEQEAKVLQLEKELNRFETTQLVFKDLLLVSQKLNKEKEVLTYKIENLTSKKDSLSSEIEHEENGWNSLASEHAQLELFRAQSEDIKRLIENKNQQHLLQEAEAGVQKGTPYVAQAKEEEQKATDLLEKEEEALEFLKNTKIDTSELLAIENWYQRNDQLQKENQDLLAKKQMLASEITQLRSEFGNNQVNPDNWETELDVKSERLNAQDASIQQKETQLQVHIKLSEFANNLHDGDECPLCGSLSHPKLMEKENLSDLENSLFREKEELTLATQANKKLYQSLAKLHSSLQEKSIQLKNIESELAQNSKSLLVHSDSFLWEEFSSVDKTLFATHKTKSQAVEQSIREAEQKLKLTRQQLQQTQQKVVQYENRIQKYQQDIVVLSKLIQQNEGQLRVLTPTDAENKSVTDLINQKQNLDSRITFLDSEYKRLTESLTKLRTELASIRGQQLEAKEQFQQLIAQLTAHQAELAALLTEHQFSDVMEVQLVLNKNLSISTLREQIQTFKIEFHSLENQIASLQAKKAEDSYTEEEYELKTELIQLKKEELELQIRLTGALEKELTRLQSEFEKKEALLAEFDKLSVRKNNLTTIENLFRAAGFVNYVSSIHLQRLCEIANERFHRLTKNQLSLSINKNNDFEVIDYLNNGYSRSIKTLSGGQSFQASLCLALALAENIQSLNKADKNFFFIDEGFGTQDAESIHTVFETLNYLHKENRIVGIISHVEELKERIPKTITVVNDLELGSRITEN
ncbi:AAA family ATPase [Sphingobacterium hungaricum]|uniref:Rad50/SbcC-type AAA domain-containing protein n=1 Tax=Sphingobacterium hungaricum TaxID=2082723 RepID=A0A928USI5_9SPHI|nr:SMC family ATPase [Sphingobacterium hungaricum]MBE8712501.1 hypothetical protein [Sphingobacterium hungaricum]